VIQRFLSTILSITPTFHIFKDRFAVGGESKMEKR